MPKILGLDVGSNSIGSAWIDTDAGEVHLGVGVFPAGVEDSDSKRGAPVNQKRRQVRSQRRSIRRRAQRKRQLRSFLGDQNLLPTASDELQAVFDLEPWVLRRDGLQRALTPFEFGRVLLHLAQRRGALGVDADGDEEAGKVKQAIEHLHSELNGRTVGEFFADLLENERLPITSLKTDSLPQPVRNRGGEFRYHADRQLVRDEFNRLWDAQKSFDSELSTLLTDDLRTKLDDDRMSQTWRQGGLLFGQRRTWWNAGTLGRCDLEPTELKCPKADMDAQEFILLSYVNDLRVDEGDGQWRRLNEHGREAVLQDLRKQKSAKVQTTLRKALRIDTKSRAKDGLPDCVRLNVEADEGRNPPTNWFYRCIVEVFGEDEWFANPQEFRDGVNRTLLRFDPKKESDVARVRQGAERWWKLSPEQADKLIEGWKQRPRRDDRVNLSRRAIRTLLSYLRQGVNVSEARKEFSSAADSGATDDQRRRYAMSGQKASVADKRYLEKHEGQLPPAPEFANPVVRKAIHEVRRHVNAYVRKFGCRPDHIVIELARDAKTSEKKANEMLARNRKRDHIRKEITEQYQLQSRTRTQQNRAIERILLCRQQRGVCAYSGATISEAQAADGTGLEVDHIVPLSRSHDNSFTNKVLVFRKANRNKGDQTVKEWLAHDPAGFGTVEQALCHLADESPDKQDYFTKGECRRKWDNIHRDAPKLEDFVNSQLTDTAYVARQVAGWLKNALYADDEPRESVDGRRLERRVFTTKGQYTAILRREWGLVESQLDREFAHVAVDSDETAHGESGQARRQKKDRSDHLHHAIDAVCIAFATGDTIQKLARIAAAQEAERGRTGQWRRGEDLKAPDPWPSVGAFRRDVLDAVRRIVVSHRAVKRNLTGAFHKETLFGPVIETGPTGEKRAVEERCTKRIFSTELKPKHLRMPESWDELYARLDEPDLTNSKRHEIRKQLARLPDPKPDKTGIVRDRDLRHQIRVALNLLGFDPDCFDPKAIQPIIKADGLRLPSGVPIRRVVLLWTKNNVARVNRSYWDSEQQAYVKYDPVEHPETVRIYETQSNHHVEIREGTTGRWHGSVVTTFEAASRVRPSKASGRVAQPAVNRDDTQDGRFIMSLSEGEIIYARRNDVPEIAPGYHVICKLDVPAAGQPKIWLAPHWDARRAGDQDRWSVTPSALRQCGPESDVPPYKVAVGPLGDVARRDD